MGYSPQDQKLWDTTKKLSVCARACAHTHTEAQGSRASPPVAPTARQSLLKLLPSQKPPSIAVQDGRTHTGPGLVSWSPPWPIPQSPACMLDEHRSGLCLAGGHHTSKLGGPRLPREALGSQPRKQKELRKSGGKGEASLVPALKDPVHPGPRRSCLHN